MTYLIQGFLALVEMVVSWFPESSSLDLSGFNLNMVIAGLNGWIDIPTLISVVNMAIAFYVVMGSVFLINWVIKRVRGG